MERKLTLIFTDSKTTGDLITKILAFLQLREKCIPTKLGGYRSKKGLPHPLEVLDIFGEKSIFEALRTFMFCIKWVLIEVIDW